MNAWGNLGMVETIYEEEYECSTGSPSLSPTLSSPSSTPLHSRVEAWSVATGHKSDVSIHVQGTCFHLHKDPLTSRSIYLKRHLTQVKELTLSPPLNITADTFALLANFCYGSHVVITPFNVAALRTAAELLQMTETDVNGDENLMQITETYFRRVIAVNGEFAMVVFRSCLPLLPEAETVAFLLSRCLEALILTHDSDDAEGDGIVSCFDDVIKMPAEEFQIVADSMQRLRSHDVAYRIVDYYIKKHSGKITEDQKTHICNSIDCNKLSPELLLDAVQNPRMPLRFIVRAMLIEQLNTRRVIFSATANQQPQRDRIQLDSMTLGAILQRDATKRQAAQLKAAMEATSSRIENLEKQLHGMKKLILECEEEINENMSRSIVDSGRSASFHHVPVNRIKRGERGSSSSMSYRFSGKERALWSSNSEEFSDETPRPGAKKSIGKRLISGLTSAFKVSSNPAWKHGSK
ncbi:BTB domain-containing protein/NPH3 domain-containing protein [Cephalotus follicularis]|uniref:BTB domain-containing protein/NPH3 domain-containing protein n=1 Tax=Cephalotus follicularis TaxID=3775 RepID=A0A1Q3CLC2_CEPFO|nr:BTB domain-containing protein/NPH3 domain-containing protein [Cephalotus follicularis]